MSGVEPASPAERPRGSRAGVWLGIVAIALGAVVMLGGLAAVLIYVRRLPPSSGPTATPALPMPPPALHLPPSPTLEPAPPPPVDTGPIDLPSPEATAPFAEDARAAVPVTAGQALWGPPTAPVTLTLFGNLECPHSIAMLRVVFAEKARRGDDLRVAFRYVPLSRHELGEDAQRALFASYDADGVGAYWSALRTFASHGTQVTRESLSSVLAPPPPGFESDAGRAIEEDAVLATALFVRATPVTFVNGVRLDGYQSQRTLAEVIAAERRKAGLALANGTTPKALYRTRTAKNLINVGDDPPLRSCVPAAESPARGPDDALVTIVEFSEHECALCRKGDALVSAVLAARARTVRSVWKTLALPQHARAKQAASLALAARELKTDGGFWSVSKELFSETTLDDGAFARVAERAGLDLGALLAAAEKPALGAAIAADERLARELDVAAVPTYFVNGRRIDGLMPLAEFRALVDRELELARRVKKNGAGNVAELACGAHAQRKRP